MSNNPSGQRFVIGLWLVAAGLSFYAAASPAFKGGEPNWAIGAPGVFCMIMAIISSRRKPGSPPR
jgi:hypothetical protein